MSLRDTRDADPYPAYAEMRRSGTVVRDEGVGAWLALGHDACTFIERREDLFAEPTGSMPGADVITGRRDLRALVGTEHDSLHGSIARPWRPRPIDSFRAVLMRPILAERLAQLATAERFELYDDVAVVVPIRFIARVLGLPDDSDDTLRRAKGWLDAVLAWRHTYGADPDVVEAAIDATRHISPMLLDVIRDRRDAPHDDMISRLWAAGAEIADDWGEADVLANTTFLFEAGAETTSLLICSLMKRLLEESPDQRAVILADPDSMRWYIDEVLRHTTVVHWRARRARRDVEVEGAVIGAGEMVHPVNAAANRDPDRWERPDAFDPRRPRLAGHLAFNVGPRHCAGAHLARLQASETVTALFRAFPDLALDTRAPAPAYRGYVSRAWRPLHLRHSARTAADVRDAVMRREDPHTPEDPSR